MTEHQQPAEPLDQHLDPDQLNAFASNALPAHERAHTLAHLADCAHCRQILYLTQQAEETEAPQPTPAKLFWRTWFTSTPFFGAATAALAGAILVAVTLHLHHASPATNNAVAVLKPEPQPTATAPPFTAAQPVDKTQPKPIVQLDAPPVPAKTPPSTQAVRGLMGGLPAMSSGTGAAPAKDLNGYSFVQPSGQMHGTASASAAPGRPVVIAGAGAPASTVNLGNGVPSAVRIMPPPRATASGPLQTNQSQMSQMNQYAQQTQPGQAQQNAFNQAQLAPLPAEGRNSTPLSAADGINLASNQAVTLETASANSVAKQKSLAFAKLPPPAPLPSKLPAASTVTAIHPQWQGKAQHLSLAAAPAIMGYLQAETTTKQKTATRAAAPAKPAAAPSSSTSSDSNATGAIIAGAPLDSVSAAPPSPTPSFALPPPTPTFQLTTDTGTIWLSDDGLIWRRR